MQIDMYSKESGELIDSFELDDDTSAILEALAMAANKTTEEIILEALKLAAEKYHDKEYQ